jgi:hypothetical protein
MARSLRISTLRVCLICDRAVEATKKQQSVIRKTGLDCQPFLQCDRLWLLPIHELFGFGKGVARKKEGPGIPLDIRLNVSSSRPRVAEISSRRCSARPASFDRSRHIEEGYT